MAEIKTRIKIIKRNGNKEEFDPEKIKRAIRKSAERAMLTLTKEAEDKTKDNKVLSKDYILEEAKYVLLNYISKFETKSEKINIKLLEKKYKKLKRITISTLVAFLIYVIITAIM